MEFLLIAVVVGAIGIGVVLWRNRQPRGVHDHVSDFQRGMQALAPSQEQRPRRRPGRSRPGER